jgi:hypothetical protein
MKVGIFFENILQRGLLEFAAALPNGAPEYRYAHHEVIEESQHSLMFQEFVNRTGLPVSGPSGLERFGARFVPALGRTFPELFFLFVLGGEEPIDYTQREALAARAVQHPLLQRIMRIHVTEEARHLCFARAFIEENVPKLGALRMLHLRVRTPFIFSIMAKQMLEPPQEIARAYLMPRSVVREAYSRNAEHRRAVMASLAKIRKLCFDLGIASPGFIELWRKLGIWPDAASAAPSGPKVNQGGQAGLAPPLTR